MAIFKEFMHCVLTPFHSQILHLFQFADEMSNSQIYKFSQNNLYSYNIIADSMEKDSYFRKQRKNNCTKIEIPKCKIILW